MNRIDTAGVTIDSSGGILVLMLACSKTLFDGSGDYISLRATDISRELERFIPEDDTMLRLAESVKHGLDLLANSASADDRFDTQCTGRTTPSCGGTLLTGQLDHTPKTDEPIRI